MMNLSSCSPRTSNPTTLQPHPRPTLRYGLNSASKLPAKEEEESRRPSSQPFVVPTNVQQIKDQIHLVFQTKGLLRRSVSSDNVAQLSLRNLLRGAVNVIETREQDLLHSVAIGQKLLQKLNDAGATTSSGSINTSFSSTSPSGSESKGTTVAMMMRAATGGGGSTHTTALSPVSSTGSPSDKENDTPTPTATTIPKISFRCTSSSSSSTSTGGHHRSKVDSALLLAQRCIVSSKTEKVNLVANLEELQAELHESKEVLQCRELRIEALVDSLQKYRKEVDHLNSEVDVLRSENISLQLRVKQLTSLKLASQLQSSDNNQRASNQYHYGRDLHSLVDCDNDLESPPRTLQFCSLSGTPSDPVLESQALTALPVSVVRPSSSSANLQQTCRMIHALKLEFTTLKQQLSSNLLDTQRQIQDACKTIEMELEQALCGGVGEGKGRKQLTQQQRFSIQGSSPEAASHQSTPSNLSELSPLAFAEHCHKMAVAAAVEEELARRLSRVMGILQVAETQLSELSAQLRRAKCDRNRAWSEVHVCTDYCEGFLESIGQAFLELANQQKRELLLR